MTDTPAPLSDDDLSADLDDEAGMDVRARILDDPQALARQAELASAVRWVSDAPVVALDEDRLDALVAGALDVLDAPPAPRRPARATGPWLVAAAVVALMAIGLTLIWTGREDATETGAGASTTMASTDEFSASDDASDEVPRPESEAATPAPGTSSATGTSPFLGTFADPEALRGALANSLEADPSADPPIATPSAETVARCEQQLQTTLELDGAPLASGYAVVDDRLVLVYEWEHESFVDGRSTTLVTAVGGDACDEVALFER